MVERRRAPRAYNPGLEFEQGVLNSSRIDRNRVFISWVLLVCLPFHSIEDRAGDATNICTNEIRAGNGEIQKKKSRR